MPRIPSLSSICIHHISDGDNDFDGLDVRLNYGPHISDDVFHGIGPRLWLTLVKIYDNLPSELRTITLPLTHTYLSQLQRVPSTPQLALITILDLPACSHLTDSSILQLRHLHSLAAFDASATSLTHYAIKALSDTLLKADTENYRRGPWSLRILRLRYCQHIDNDVHSYLTRFPLLTVVDLRGTKCRPINDSTFHPSSNLAFFHPSPLSAAIDILPSPNLYSSENVFKILINTLGHPTVVPKPTNIPKESYVFVPNRHRDPRLSKREDSRRHELFTQLPQNLDFSLKETCHSDEYAKDGLRHGDENSHDEQSDRARGAEEIPKVTDPPASSPLLDDMTLLPVPNVNHSFSLHRATELRPEAFYHQKSRSPKYDPVKNYSAEGYYARANTDELHVTRSHDDGKLALYRTPPAWETLDLSSVEIPKEHQHSRSRMSKTTGGFAVVNRARMGFQIGQERMDALRKNATRSSTAGVAHAQISSPCTHFAFERNKNPFRRHSTSSSDTIKPLKPISSLEVPLLPPQYENQRSTATSLRPSRSKAGMASLSFAGNNKPTPRNRPIRTGLQAPHPEENAPRKKSKTKDVFNGSNSSHTKVGKAGQSSHSLKPAFDWGSWSTSSR